MVRLFIVTKEFFNFEVVIDSTIVVKPLPAEGTGHETIALAAQVHQVAMELHCQHNKENNLVIVALQYFDRKGYKISEIENN